MCLHLSSQYRLLVSHSNLNIPQRTRLSLLAPLPAPPDSTLWFLTCGCHSWPICSPYRSQSDVSRTRASSLRASCHFHGFHFVPSIFPLRLEASCPPSPITLHARSLGSLRSLPGVPSVHRLPNAPAGILPSRCMGRVTLCCHCPTLVCARVHTLNQDKAARSPPCL